MDVRKLSLSVFGNAEIDSFSLVPMIQTFFYVWAAAFEVFPTELRSSLIKFKSLASC